MIDVRYFTLIYLWKAQMLLFQEMAEPAPFVLKLGSDGFISRINIIAGYLPPIVNEMIILDLKNMVS